MSQLHIQITSLAPRSTVGWALFAPTVNVRIFYRWYRMSYRMSYRTRPPQGVGSASGVKRTDNVQTLTHPCHEVSIVLIWKCLWFQLQSLLHPSGSTDFGKRSLKYRAAKYYNDLPEEIKFKLDDSWRYNKSVLSNYLFNIEHWFSSHHIYIKLINLLSHSPYTFV